MVAMGASPHSETRSFDRCFFMKTLLAAIFRKLGLAFLPAIGVMAAMGCHTANGFGKDLQDAGEGIQKSTK